MTVCCYLNVNTILIARFVFYPHKKPGSKIRVLEYKLTIQTRDSATVAGEGTHQEVVNAWHCAIQAINKESRGKQSGQCLLSPVEA